MPNLSRRLAAECLGTALLLTAVIGSGIMAQRLCGGSDGLALLANSLATGGALFILITSFGAISGAHFNPAVTLAMAVQKHISWKHAGLYIVAQQLGALLGVALANVMFDLPFLFESHHARHGVGQLLGEMVATFGLLTVIFALQHHALVTVAAAVSCYIFSAYWFTSSTSFANPAATLARAFTDTAGGIAAADVGGFVAAQLVGVAVALPVCSWLFAAKAEGETIL